MGEAVPLDLGGVRLFPLEVVVPFIAGSSHSGSESEVCAGADFESFGAAVEEGVLAAGVEAT